MLRKLVAASVAALMLLALVPASMAQSDKIQPYSGMVGSDSPLYTIKLYVEKLNVFLTLDSHDKLQKQLAYADERLAEAQAAAINNNTAAIDAALNEYENQMSEVNSTIDNGSTAIVDPEIDDDEQTILDMINNSSLSYNSTVHLIDLYNQNIDIKYGRPFIYVNNTTTGNITAYFAPPGQLKKINMTNLPPGLAKKGFKLPVPTITNGSTVWPWDDVQYVYNGSPTVSNTNTKTHGNGNGHANGNGKSNGNGNGNGKNK